MLFRLRKRLFGKPSNALNLPQIPKKFFLWRIARGIFFWPIRLLLRLIRRGNTRGYWRTRNWRRLLYGLPALLVLFGTVSLGLAMARLDNAQLAKSNLERAQELVSANHERAALTHAEAASRLNPNDPSGLMALAYLSGRTGDHVRQKAILSSLAPNDRLGHPPAHLALARLLLAESPTKPNQFSVAAEKQLLRVATQDGELGIAANTLLGASYWDAGSLKEAVQHLRRAPAKSEARVLLAKAYSSLGDFEPAAAEAKACREEFESRLRSNPADARSRYLLSECLSILKEFGGAIKVCDEGIGVAGTKQEAIDNLLSRRNETYVTWLVALESAPKPDVALRFAVLEKALSVAPADVRFLARLLAYTDPQSTEGAKARTLLNEQLTRGRNIGLAHFVLGTYAWSEHDRAKSEADRKEHLRSAEFHLELAHKTMSQDANILNNLAWVVANASQPQLERALLLSNSAIERVPNFPEYRHTRGHILMKMERWKDAVLDLEFALAGGAYPDQANLHVSLAKTYEKLGDVKMAALHREAATPKKPPGK
jgi:tetratricopeptide (TPR) repeat protein